MLSVYHYIVLQLSNASTSLYETWMYVDVT
jgi:hypothetical protein